MRKLTIDRDRWARGGKNGLSKLLNVRGNMCCLGFETIACGFAENEILGAGTPGGLAQRLRREGLEHLLEADENTNNYFTILAMEINDNEDLGEDAREAMLENLFAMKGIELEFINSKWE